MWVTLSVLKQSMINLQSYIVRCGRLIESHIARPNNHFIRRTRCQKWCREYRKRSERMREIFQHTERIVKLILVMREFTDRKTKCHLRKLWKRLYVGIVWAECYSPLPVPKRYSCKSDQWYSRRNPRCSPQHTRSKRRANFVGLVEHRQ